MDLLKKIELLISSTTRSKLPRRERRSILDEQEEQLLAEIREAVAQVQAQERVLAERLMTERTQAQEAAARGELDDQRTHERRATELARQLEQESIQAINLEEKLAELEEKLALAKEAVEKEAQKVAAREAEADQAITQSGSKIDARTEAILNAPTTDVSPDDRTNKDTDLETRKSRLSD